MTKTATAPGTHTLVEHESASRCAAGCGQHSEYIAVSAAERPYIGWLQHLATRTLGEDPAESLHPLMALIGEAAFTQLDDLTDIKAFPVCGDHAWSYAGIDEAAVERETA